MPNLKLKNMLDTYDEHNPNHPFNRDDEDEQTNELLQENWKLRLKLGDRDLLILQIKELVQDQENGICIIIKNLIK